MTHRSKRRVPARKIAAALLALTLLLSLAPGAAFAAWQRPDNSPSELSDALYYDEWPLSYGGAGYPLTTVESLPERTQVYVMHKQDQSTLQWVPVPIPENIAGYTRVDDPSKLIAKTWCTACDDFYVLLADDNIGSFMPPKMSPTIAIRDGVTAPSGYEYYKTIALAVGESAQLYVDSPDDVTSLWSVALMDFSQNDVGAIQSAEGCATITAGGLLEILQEPSPNLSITVRLMTNNGDALLDLVRRVAPASDVIRVGIVSMLCARYFFGVYTDEDVSNAIDNYINVIGLTLDPAPFPDVNETLTGAYRNKFVAFAKAMGWIQGDANGNFGPYEKMTGLEVATLTAKALKSTVRINGDITSPATWARLGVDTYASATAVDTDQANDIISAVQNGLATPSVLGPPFTISGMLALSWTKVSASATEPRVNLNVYAVNAPSRALVATGTTTDGLPSQLDPPGTYWYTAEFGIPALNPAVGTASYEIDVLGSGGEVLYTAPLDSAISVTSEDENHKDSIDAYVNEATYYTLVKELRLTGKFPAGAYSLQIGNLNRAVTLPESTNSISLPVDDVIGAKFELTPWSLGKAPDYSTVFTPEITRYKPAAVYGTGTVVGNDKVFDNVLEMPQPFIIAYNGDSWDPLNSNCDLAFFNAMRDAGVIDSAGKLTTAYKGARFYGFYNLSAFETFPVIDKIDGYTRVYSLNGLDPEKAVFYGFTAGNYNYMMVLKHTWVVQTSIEPTCETAGSITYVCTDCGSTRTVSIPAKGHDYRGVYVAPECEKAGSYTMVCAHDSNHKLDTATIPALGHDWGDWTVVTAAQIGEAGQEQRVCKRDSSHKETRAIPALVADKFTVTYIDGVDGALLGSVNVTSGESAAPPTLTEKTGYTFTGWKRSDGKGISAPITAATVFTATYTKLAEKFTVTFAAPSGSGGVLEAIGKPQEISRGFVATPPAPPAITGKRFIGWDIPFDANGKTFTVTSNMTITAIYEDTQYFSIVYLDSWGFYSGSELVESGGNGTHVGAEIPGYKFVGWYPSVENVQAHIVTRPLYLFDTDAWLAAWSWGLTAAEHSTPNTPLAKPGENDASTANYWGFVYNNALYVDRAVTITAPASGPAINKDVYLNYPDIKTDGLKLSGANTLYITDKVGDGDVSIKGFTGNLHVAGGGSHSVHISDSTIGTLTVAKAQDSGAEPVSIKADSGTTLANVDVQSPVKLEPEASDDTPTITAVTVNTAAASDVVEISTAVSTLTFETSATVALSAPVETVSVSAGADEATVAAVNDAATVGTVKADSTVMDKITLVGNDSLESAAESIVETFTVTATADPNGSVTPAKANVESGGSVTFTFEPDDGYEVDKVTERAATLQSGGVSYTFENVTESHTIHVTFKAKSNNISPLPPSGGGTSSGGSSNTKDTAKAGSVSGAAADTSALPDELKNLKVAFAQVELSSLPGEIQTMVKAGALAFDITATADGADTHDLKGGVVSVSIPFKAPSGVKASKVAAYWLNGGKLEPVNGKFDRATGKMTMKLRHFSTYVIKVNDVKYTATGGWYDTDDLDYAVQRGLLDKFIAGGKLDAGATITRGEFIVAIMKSLGIAPHTEFETTFTDVSGADAAYLNTAKAMGIVSGVNEARTLFEPNRAATRGEQFQIMYNLMTAKLVTLETGNSSKTLADFADGESVPEWLRPALSALLKSGVVRGDGRNLLINGAFTLGQAASVIERMR